MTHPRTVSCKSCQAQIVFFWTAKGNMMPVDAATVQPGDTELDLSRHKSHFASCTNSDKHRKRK